MDPVEALHTTPLVSRKVETNQTQENLELVAAKIKLKRLGKIRNPQYRIVVADARNKRDGRAIEELGLYHPKEEPSFIKVDSDRIQYWLGVGAQPTDAVRAILRVTGDWQKFKGEPGAEGTLRVAESKVDKVTLFAAAVEDGAKAKNEPAPKLKKAEPEPVAEKPAEDAAKAPAEAAAEAPAEDAATESAAEAKVEEPVAEAKTDEPVAEEAVESTPANEEA